MSSNHWLVELSHLLSGRDLDREINNISGEFVLQDWIPIIKRSKMKYVDFKGREWSVEKGDWVSYQMLDKRSQKTLFNKNILKKFFYVISLALLTAYFWLG